MKINNKQHGYSLATFEAAIHSIKTLDVSLLNSEVNNLQSDLRYSTNHIDQLNNSNYDNDNDEYEMEYQMKYEGEYDDITLDD